MIIIEIIIVSAGYLLSEPKIIAKIEKRLLLKLMQFAEENEIPIRYRQNWESAGSMMFTTDANEKNPRDYEIVISDEHKDKIYRYIILAHELGHYISILESYDKTEESANMKALSLCKKLLNPLERMIIGNRLNYYFYNEKTTKIS